MSAPIQVLIVGVNAHRGWAPEGHIPALRALPAYKITAVSTTNQESADAAAAAFGVKLAFDNHHDLVTTDLRDGSHNAPDFAGALRTFRVIEVVESAAASGARVSLPKAI
jgi:hypothetical protein